MGKKSIFVPIGKAGQEEPRAPMSASKYIQACLLSYLPLLIRSWTFPMVLITTRRGEGEQHRCAAGTPWCCSNHSFKLLSALGGDAPDITEFRGLQYQGESHNQSPPIHPAAPWTDSHPLAGTPESCVLHHLHPTGSGKRGLAGNPGRHRSSLHGAPMFSRQTPLRGDASQAQEDAERVHECWGISRRCL